MSGIQLERVSKEFPNGFVAVDGISLDVADGEFMALVGPSGCGKTTTLRMVAGLEEATAGTIRIGDREVTDLPPRKRDVAMVFQSYALYAHMSVRGNIGFGLKMAGMPKAEIASRVDEAARILGMTELLDRKPRQLSGGQRQRVAMGRAIVRRPAAFLMDEPLSNLDAKLRVEMRGEITALQRRIETPTLYVTHDQTEAMTMGDRVAILRDGVIEQLGAPAELYEQPANMFVASFIGSPAMNLISGRCERVDGRLTVTVGEARITIPEAIAASRSELGSFAGRDVCLGIRPEDFIDVAEPDVDDAVDVVVTRSESLGAELFVYFEELAHARAQGPEEAGDPVLDDLEATRRSTMVARLDRDCRVSVGERCRLRIDPARIYLFDPETTQAIR
ncbi:MAG: sn-glycerol-3-phosphate ABC transporter ATP-binding protein UgpC [Solirubrobacterales bacterium]